MERLMPVLRASRQVRQQRDGREFIALQFLRPVQWNGNLEPVALIQKMANASHVVLSSLFLLFQESEELFGSAIQVLNAATPF